MRLKGLHLLLTYQCTFECEHCFVWGSPWASGTMTLAQIQAILVAGRSLGTVKSIYFEGGEPFLYYATLLQGARLARQMGFTVGMVSNAYWATSLPDAVEFLKSFTDVLADLSVSSDLYHYDEMVSRQSHYASQAAESLGIPVGMISIAQPADRAAQSAGQLPESESAVMFRGRAAARLADQVPHFPWQQFDACPHEDLREPGRVHVDAWGNLHICQGISLGNLFETPLQEICAAYDPEAHPICGPLLAGGPAELSRRYQVPVEEHYADACHLCYQTRLALRERFPGILTPDQMYGIMGNE